MRPGYAGRDACCLCAAASAGDTTVAQGVWALCSKRLDERRALVRTRIFLAGLLLGIVLGLAGFLAVPALLRSRAPSEVAVAARYKLLPDRIAAEQAEERGLAPPDAPLEPDLAGDFHRPGCHKLKGRWLAVPLSRLEPAASPCFVCLPPTRSDGEERWMLSVREYHLRQGLRGR